MHRFGSAGTQVTKRKEGRLVLLAKPHAMATILDALADRLEHIQTSEYELTTLRDRLCLLALADGGKPAFEALLDDCALDAAQALARVASEFGLVTKFVVLDGTCLLRTPNVPPLVLKAIVDLWRPRYRIRSLWIARRFLDIPRRDRLLPEASEGAYLGYPTCCVAAYLEKTRRRAEAFYRLAQQRNSGKRDAELAHWIRSDPVLTNEEADRLLGLNAVLKSDQAFPFVPHIACPDCLSGKTAATSKQNTYFEELARQAGLRDRILHAVMELVGRPGPSPPAQAI